MSLDQLKGDSANILNAINK